MPHIIIIEYEAKADLADAAKYYEAESPGLGARFLRETRAFLDQIAEQPALYSLYRRETHSARVPRFPYLVLYRFDRQTIWILAVMHGARDPRVLRKRTR